MPQDFDLTLMAGETLDEEYFEALDAAIRARAVHFVDGSGVFIDREDQDGCHFDLGSIVKFPVRAAFVVEPADPATADGDAIVPSVGTFRFAERTSDDPMTIGPPVEDDDEELPPGLDFYHDDPTAPSPPAGAMVKVHRHPWGWGLVGGGGGSIRTGILTTNLTARSGNTLGTGQARFCETDATAGTEVPTGDPVTVRNSYAIVFTSHATKRAKFHFEGGVWKLLEREC